MSKEFLALRGRRIKAAMRERGLTEQALADHFGTNQQTINKIINGTTQRSGFFPEMQRLLGLSIEELIEQSRIAQASIVTQKSLVNTPAGEHDFPIHAAAEGGTAGEIIVSSNPVEWKLRPEPLLGVPESYGIIVVGDSMLPEFEAGDIALVHPYKPPERGRTHIFYAVDHGETRAMIKRLLRWNDSHWLVLQHNPPKGQRAEFSLLRKDWVTVHRVVGKYSR